MMYRDERAPGTPKPDRPNVSKSESNTPKASKETGKRSSREARRQSRRRAITLSAQKTAPAPAAIQVPVATGAPNVATKYVAARSAPAARSLAVVLGSRPT